MKKSIIPFYIPTDQLIAKSIDCYLYDVEGKEYIDFEAGVWCANVGHNNERLNKVMKSQVDETIHHGYRFRNQSSERLAEKLNEKLEFEDGQSVFLSSGSEAVNLAITISRHITNREKILKINNSFVSAYGFGQLSPNNGYKVDIKFNDLDAIAQIDFEEIAAFILESGGASVEVVQFPDIEFVRKLVETAKENGAVFIVDEVTTGFGRTGEWFGFMHYDVKPDIVVTAKGLGNGFPISGVTINSGIVKILNRSPLNYLQSHINDPLGCAISLEVFQIIDDENLIVRCREVGLYFKKQLCLLKDKHTNKISEVRGRGLILALEFSEQVDGNWINNQLFDVGLLVGFKLNTLRLLPPLTIKVEDINKLITEIDRLLNSLPQTQ